MLRRTFLAQVAAALDRGRLDRAIRVMDEVTRTGEVAAASLCVRRGSSLVRHVCGQAKSVDTPFLLASITKPMTATGVMILVDRREISLSDNVRKYIPEFRGGDRDTVTIRHLLTHTSGLPDMLPDNEALRRRHAPLQDFVAGTCRVPLLFKPGAECRYQSMGILLAAEIAQRVTKTPFREFLRKEVFGPLGLSRTSLGLGGRRIADTALCQVSGDEDWNWNSPYWRNLGAPWGGAHSTGAEVTRFVEYFLQPDDRVLKPRTAASMIVNQNLGLNEPFGIGFRVGPGSFGKACSTRAFGHWGSTGTVTWADPATGVSFALLTTKPASESRDSVLAPVSDAVSQV
ncbi:MAG TPA: serine hydrolase domain-containing protein [Bryobacteraceae bacterium]|nr:serine hydrolase domain-containing protein [Bryobacteraceae bacterium]